jgi:hypothetical protein
MERRKQVLQLPGWLRAVMGALSLLGILVSIASAPQAVRDALGSIVLFSSPIPWFLVVAAALVLGLLALASGGPRFRREEVREHAAPADESVALGRQIDSLSEANRALERQNALLKRRISELTPPESPVEWDDLTEDQKQILERMFVEGPVSRRHLDADTNLYEKHGFIERVANVSPGLTATFRLTEKSLARLRARHRDVW